MNCLSCQELFSEYTDNMLDQELMGPFKEHLDSCPQCSKEYRYFTSTVTVLRSLPLVQAPEDLLQGIYQKLSLYPQKTSFRQKIRAWIEQADFSMSLPTATATVAVAVAVMLMVKNIALTPPSPELTQKQPHTASIATSDNIAPPPAPATHIPTPRNLDAVYSIFSNNFLPFPQPNGTDFVAATSPPSTFPLEQFPTPDMFVTLHAKSHQQHFQLCRKIMTDPGWQAHLVSTDTMLIALDPCKLKKLHAILSGQDATVFPPAAQHTAYGSPKRLITIALRMQ